LDGCVLHEHWLGCCGCWHGLRLDGQEVGWNELDELKLGLGQACCRVLDLWYLVTDLLWQVLCWRRLRELVMWLQLNDLHLLVGRESDGGCNGCRSRCKAFQRGLLLLLLLRKSLGSTHASCEARIGGGEEVGRYACLCSEFVILNLNWLRVLLCLHRLLDGTTLPQLHHASWLRQIFVVDQVWSVKPVYQFVDEHLIGQPCFR